MTPEEQAVIDAALTWGRTETIGQAEDASYALQDALAELVKSRIPDTSAKWVETTWRYALPGDHVRMNGAYATVMKSSTSHWHIDPQSSKYEPIALEHEAVNVALALPVGPEDEYSTVKPYSFVPGLAVEIEMTAERRAVHTVQRAFPGSTLL